VSLLSSVQPNRAAGDGASAARNDLAALQQQIAELTAALRALQATVQQTAARAPQNAGAGAVPAGPALPVPLGASFRLPFRLADYLALAGDAEETAILPALVVASTTVPAATPNWGLQFIVPPGFVVLSFSQWDVAAEYYTADLTLMVWTQYGLTQWTAAPTSVIAGKPGLALAGPIGPPGSNAIPLTLGAIPVLQSGAVPATVTEQHEIPQDLTLIWNNASGVDILVEFSFVIGLIPIANWKTYFEPLRASLRTLWPLLGPTLAAAAQSQGGA